MSKTQPNPRLTHKDYERHFDVSKPTAQRYIARDRKAIAKKRITAIDFMRLYSYPIFVT